MMDDELTLASSATTCQSDNTLANPATIPTAADKHDSAKQANVNGNFKTEPGADISNHTRMITN